MATSLWCAVFWPTLYIVEMAFSQDGNPSRCNLEKFINFSLIYIYIYIKFHEINLENFVIFC